MPNCSAPGCNGNYAPEERVPDFQYLNFLKAHPRFDTLGYVLSIGEDIANLKNVYVCSKHFLKEDINCITQYQKEMAHSMRSPVEDQN